MKTIRVNNSIRVNDLDVNQYALERCSISKDGTETWKAFAFCSSPASVASTLREYLTYLKVQEARSAAQKEFDESDLLKQIQKLPKKNGK